MANPHYQTNAAPDAKPHPAHFVIERVDLIGFRGYRKTAIDFSSPVTAIIGDNGAGKTSILEAVRVALSWLAARIEKVQGRGGKLAQSDIHAERDETVVEVGVAFREGRGPNLARHHWRVGSTRHGSGDSVSSSQSLRGVGDLAQSFYFTTEREGAKPLPLPVLAFYSVGRSVVTLPKRIAARHKFDRLDTYEGALDGGAADFRSFFEWFREHEDLELEQRQRSDSRYVDRSLEATRQAIRSLMPGYGSPFIRRHANEMILEKDGAELSVAQLSDGERTLITMVADIARRLCLATELTALHDSPLLGYGVVLIDEVELHLHPAWQQQVLERLTTTFPGLQFIVTTHSPLVLSTIGRDDIRVLATQPHEDSPYPDRRVYTPGRETEGVDVDQVLLSVMGVDPTPDRPINRTANTYRGLIQDGESGSPQAEDLFAELRDHFGENSPTFQEILSLKRIYERRARVAALKPS